MSNPKSQPTELGDILAADAYLRERLRPTLRDMNYPGFKDLLVVVRAFAAGMSAGSRVFDYGCGGAPYESLFAHCARYVRADIVPGPKVELMLRPDGLTDEPEASYDGVLSSQVLEHVPEPLAYLRETYRLLKPGGEALVTTHGLFEEHGCPHDYTRWTINGLERLARQAGFEVVESRKLTTQIRGAVQLMSYFAETLRLPGRRSVTWYLLDFLRRVYRRGLRPLGNWLTDRFPEQCVVAGDDPAAVYVGISVRLRRPA